MLSYQKKFRRTKKGVISTLWHHQLENSKNRGMAKPTYTKEWLRDWLMNKPKFHKLYDMWVLSGYDRLKKPSVDRKDDYIGYTEYNIQIMTFEENAQKNYKNTFLGINKKQLKAVEQYDKQGELLAVYFSARETHRQTGVSYKQISKVCNGKAKTASGYFWSFKK